MTTVLVDGMRVGLPGLGRARPAVLGGPVSCRLVVCYLRGFWLTTRFPEHLAGMAQLGTEQLGS
jgi:hypothetical protein